MRDRIYTTFEISRFCSVDISTVMGWVDDGKLPAYRTPGGHRRIKHDDLIDFLKKFHMPVHPMLVDENTRVLIVDDDPLEIRMLKRVLEKMASAQVDVARDGFEAGQKLETFKPDIILLDLMLPGVDGFQVCKNIRADERKKNIKILAISGLRAEDTKKKILSMGADEFISKPFNLDHLRYVIGTLMERDRRIAEKNARRPRAPAKPSHHVR